VESILGFLLIAGALAALIGGSIAQPGTMLCFGGFGVLFFIVAGVVNGFGAFRDAINDPDHAPPPGGLAKARDDEIRRREALAAGEYDPRWQAELERAAMEAVEKYRREYPDDHERAQRLPARWAHKALRSAREARATQSRASQDYAYSFLQSATGHAPPPPPHRYPDGGSEFEAKAARGCGIVFLAFVIWVVAVISLAAAGVLR